MNRRAEALELTEALLTDVELAQTSTSRRVLKTLRLARLLRDVVAQEWLGYELNGVPGTEAGQTWMARTKRWIDREAKTGYWGSASAVEAMMESSQSALAGHSAQVSLSGDYVSSAMNNRATQINRGAGQIAALARVLGAVDAQIYQYAADTYAELRFGEVQASLFEQAQQSVDGSLAGMAGNALRMIDSLAERLGSDDPSAVSQAMTTCRQLIDAVADHLFKPRDEPYELNDQMRLDVKADKVKNRINASIHQRGIAGGQAARLGNTLNHLYDRVSAGVHNSAVISGQEARYIFINTYTFLGEVLTLDRAESD